MEPCHKESRVLSFRLGARHYGALAQQAATIGLSPGETARQMVLEALLGASVTLSLEASIRDIHSAVERLRTGDEQLAGDIATGVEVLLVAAAKVPPEEAKRWVEQNLGGASA